MGTQIFINLPVKNLDKSVEFFTGLGFTQNKDFTDENASSMMITDDIVVMLLTETFFKTFTKKEIADATTTTEAIIALGLESRAKVDEMCDKALATGGSAANETQDHGFMYGRSFADPDGHLWEVTYMDLSAMPQ
ncbi:VOC family protein [Prauserella cavernicola]|uniref:VOC family protein n=1 Tax=Prauserella cavernicola TaxID=2800127 RepID=A0A934QR57_9PSEU|nr:VOC family protein [Prauserella cavernicola]MBK1784860.1 VOC family protein [Prauserella cavernicola]